MTKAQLPSKSHPISPRRVLAVLVALLVFFLLLTSVINLFEKYRGLKAERAELYKEQAAIARKKDSLKTTNAYLETDEGREQALREKYNLVKPGEGIIVITTPPPEKPVLEERSRVGRWWDAIVHGLGFGKE